MQFVSYKTKSDAKRGLNRKTVDELNPEHYLRQQEGKWGFDMKAGAPFPLPAFQKEDETDHFHPEAGASAEEIAAVADTPAKVIWPGTEKILAKADAELEAALHQHHDDGSDAQPQSAFGAFGAFAMGQLTNKPSETPAAQSTSQSLTKIEKNRPEQNGVKRPSSGTQCAKVWDIATKLSNGDELPRTKIATLSEVVKASMADGINQFTARTQYARWRVFHGITGRLGS